MSELATIPHSNGRLPALSNGAPNRTLNMVQIMSDAPTFEQIQRASKLFAASTLVPEHLRGNVANVMIAMSMAFTLGEDPLLVMQSIYFVSGKAGWAASYMIGRANKSGVFKGNIDWRETGEGDNLCVTAFATKADTGTEVSIDASMKMAIAEGWTRNSKYKSMPRLMLRYRAATMLIRLYAPEVMLGKTIEEVEDIHYSQADNDITIDVPTGQLEDLLNMPEPPETVAEKIGEERLAEMIKSADEQPRQRDVSTWMLFKTAMETHARDIKADVEKFDAMMGWIGLNNPDVKKTTILGTQARQSFYNDFVNGKPIGEFVFAKAEVV